jgi:hypothetical protein
MELREASGRDLVNYYKFVQKLNEDCERLWGQHKELEEDALPIARLLVPHQGGPKIAPLVDRLKEAPGASGNLCEASGEVYPQSGLSVYEVILPQGSVDVVAGGLAANCTDDKYKELLEHMVPITEQVVEKLNLQ